MKRKAAARFVLSEHTSSPINIVGAPHYNAPKIQFNYPEELAFDLSITNGVVTALVADSHHGFASITINGKSYSLKQMHVHSPSEHTIDDERHTLEWHFVHQTDEGEYAVIGVFMQQEDSVSVPYFPLFRALADSDVSCILPPRALIPHNLEGWHYQGTLTTEPYDPVYWVVVKEMVSIDENSLAILVKAKLLPARGI